MHALSSFQRTGFPTAPAAGLPAAPRRIRPPPPGASAVFRGTFRGYSRVHLVSSIFTPLRSLAKIAREATFRGIVLPDRNCRGDDFDLGLTYRLTSSPRRAPCPLFTRSWSCSRRFGFVRRTFQYYASPIPSSSCFSPGTKKLQIRLEQRVRSAGGLVTTSDDPTRLRAGCQPRGILNKK